MATTIRKHYDQLLLDNISAVSTIESGIRNVTWLLPGRFQDAEVASEGLYTLLRLVSSYHDTIISKRIKPSFSLPPHPFDANTVTPKAAPTAPADASNATQPIGTLPRVTPLLPPPSDHTRYTRYWAQTSTIYRKASRTIAVLGYVELLVEMLARKRGERARWRIVAIIEAVKTFLRLVLLRLTRRPVLSHPVPYREYDPASLPPEIVSAPSDSSAPSPQASSSSTSPASSTDKREPILPHLRGSTLRSHLQPLLPALPESHQPHPLTLLPELDGRGYAAEMLAGSATLVHVLLLLRWARRHPISPYKPLSLPTLSRPLLPFLLPLLMRLVARHLRSPLSSSSPSPQSTALLAEHYASQDRTLLMTFFFTGPMWIGWTRPKIQSWIDWFGRWPGGGLIGGFAEGYLPLVDDLFYYTSS